MNNVKCINCGKRNIDWATINEGRCPLCLTRCHIQWNITPKYYCDKNYWKGKE
jgi:hypothetical protein